MTEETTPPPEGQDPPAEAIDALAADYVLGLLDPRAHARVERRARRDKHLALAIAGWSARLEPLAGLAPPAEPSALLWPRIARNLPRPRAANPAAIWRMAALGGYAIAATLAIVILSGRNLDIAIPPWRQPPAISGAGGAPVTLDLPPEQVAAAPLPASLSPPAPASLPAAFVAPPPDRALALLTAPGQTQPALKIHVVDDTVRVQKLRPIAIAAGRRLGLWVWPQGRTAPILLGMIGRAGGTLPFPVDKIAEGTPMMVTSEPAGARKKDAVGPTLFAGTLVLED